ncbi:MAG: glycosyltransferase [Candidatus Goldiibacteriota bacterium]
MKMLILSSQARNTGSALRAEYIFKYMKKKNRNTDYIRPPFKSMPFMLDFLLSMFYYFFRLLNLKYDAVFIVKPYPNTVLPALLLRAAGAKLIIDIDDLDHGYRKGLLSGFVSFIQDRMTVCADHITTHNRALEKRIKKRYPGYKNRLYYLKQCVDLGIFSPKRKYRKKAAGIRKKFKGKKILFYTAHMNIAGYMEEIFEAVKPVKEDFVLIAAGGGPLLKRLVKKSIKAGLAGKVVFTGPLSAEETASYMQAADICLVYYADREVNKYRASMKLREYLAFSKPVAANRVGEIKDFRKFIYMSPPGVKAFSRLISSVMKKLDKREEKGYKFIKDSYNWEKEIESFKKYIDEVVLAA